MYKDYLQKVNNLSFEAIIYLAVVNLLVHNNITISYYGQVNSLRLRSNVASKWESKYLWGTIYFAVVGTLRT